MNRPSIRVPEAEWAILHSIVRGVNTPADDTAFQVALRTNIVWSELVELAAVHRVLAPLGHHVLRLDAYTAPRWARHIFRDITALNEARIQCYQRFLLRLVSGLDRAGIAFVATKGASFYSMYPRGCRQASLDIDLMIHPNDREPIAATLAELGMVQGQYHKETGTIRPHDRREQIVYAMNPDHMLRFGMITDDPVLPCIEVDVANSMTWSNSEYSVDLKEIIRRRTFIETRLGGNSVRVPSMHITDTLVHTAMHLFREAWFERSSYEVNLRKFADVMLIWRKILSLGAAGDVASHLTTCGVREPVSWVLNHMDLTFGTSAMRALGFGDLPATLLGAAYGRNRQRVYWHGDMKRRLLEHELLLELSAEPLEA